MDNIKDLLGAEIESEFKKISSLQEGSKEKSTAIEDLTKLYKLRIEEIKTEADFNEKRERREMERVHNDEELSIKERLELLELKKVDEQIKDRYFKLGVAAAEIILPLIFYSTWMKRGLKFEETGTFTSTTFKGLFNRFRPTK